MRTGSAVVLLALAAGCLARTAMEPRFFRPGSALLRESEASDAGVAAEGFLRAVRIRAVEGESFLLERVVWRASAIEYGFYEQRRWHERPASYVDRALRAAFHKSARVRLTDDLRVPSLHVAVTAFDEVLAPAHVAAVEAMVSLRDPHGQLLLERTFAAEMPIAGDDPATMAAAMGAALDDVAAHVADAVADAVPSPPGSAHENGARRKRHPIPHGRTRS